MPPFHPTAAPHGYILPHKKQSKRMLSEASDQNFRIKSQIAKLSIPFPRDFMFLIYITSCSLCYGSGVYSNKLLIVLNGSAVYSNKLFVV